MQSLNARLTLATSLLLAAFLGLAGWTLDRAFRESAESAVHERLQAQIYGLLAAADLNAQGGIELPAELPDERFRRPGSGLYAQVIQHDGAAAWQSRSLLGQELPLPPRLSPGSWQFDRLPAHGDPRLFRLGLGVAWDLTGDLTGDLAEDPDGRSVGFSFWVSESPGAYLAQVSRFRQNLWVWFGALALGLLLAQGLVLRWGLAPLRRAERDLAAVEAGTQDGLSGRYPRELRGLTDNLDALLRSERGRLARYRNALADLAHSLKTPLAVLHGASRQGDPQELHVIVREQTERMGQIVDYQLQRAATSGRTTLLAPVAIAPALQRIVRTLEKVYAERRLVFTVDAAATLQFRADESDLLELCGNLLDNACKWARQRVRVEARIDTDISTGIKTGSGDGTDSAALLITVEDDGPGVDAAQRRAVFSRGVRADSTVPGQGIGLAMVRDIAAAYGGRIEIDHSPTLGGARVQVWLPVGPRPALS